MGAMPTFNEETGEFEVPSVFSGTGEGLFQHADDDYLFTPNSLTQTQVQTQALSAQKQASDVQLNPLPSLPSISNVGSVAPTGVVNWNAIPGGFQPLPQVAGGRKKLYQLSQFHGGINQKSSPRDISDQECQEATNVTVSQVGRIKLLGDCLNTNNSLTVTDDDPLAGSDMGTSGYGLFQFAAPVDQAGGNAGLQHITLTASGNGVDAKSTDGGDTNDWMTIGGEDNHNVSQVYYAAGNGIYAADATFPVNGNANTAKIYVYRKDINGAVEVKGWEEGSPLLTSPDKGSSTNDVEGDYDGTFTAEGDNGSMSVFIFPNGVGTWSGTYVFYVSYLFDGGCETGLSSIGTDALDNNILEFNVSIKHHTTSYHLGGLKRIEGARVYFKKEGTAERFLLAEISLIDGVKGALDSTFTPWNAPGSDVYNLAANILFENPPEVYSYASLNGYYANEVYTKSPDAVDTAPTPIPIRYKTAVVGQAGIVFIGNVMFDSKHMPDSMMFSMPGKPGVFPKFNRFDSPSSDGSPITALAAFQDKILQFKQNAMFVINVSNPAQFYAEASFRDCGVFNPCQVFTTSFGVIFANKHGCFIYDGSKVISLTGGKFDVTDWGLSEGAAPNDQTASVPSIGYDPRSQSIIVLKDIGDNSVDDDGWVYSMVTQSWTEGVDMIVNVDDNRFTNFIITSQPSTGGYLSLKKQDSNTVFNYNHDKAVDTDAQTITYWTKDLDFGLPTQTKFLYKVYITYKGDADQLTCAYGVNGETHTSDLYHFSRDSIGGTTHSLPLYDKSSAENLESWHVATLYPDDATEGKDWKSISLYFNGEVGSTFEINDISILYRVRPIK